MSGYRLPYRSKFEIKVAADLGKRKVAFEYEKVSFDYVPKIRNYTPDFYLPESKIYIETKGRLTTNDRVKHLLVKKQNPDVDIKFFFSNANKKIYKGSKTTHAAWAERHGFDWAHKKIPMEWFDE